MKVYLKVILVSFLSGMLGAYILFRYEVKDQLSQPNPPQFASLTSQESKPVVSAARPDQPVRTAADPVLDFSQAASAATPSVVYVKSITEGASYSYWDFLFGEGSQTQVSSGSGVIFSPDGYIVTNNHVVSEAERIEVQYNKRVYPADVVGTDPSTDLAVLKIDDKNLPAIKLGSSADLRVGEWVIAVGNPFSLSSTVTAGIVSAKGRRIGILKDKFPIESFIQTDAAINPGNSGGALVNRNGELVGINSAILSRTGSYTGYAFAVPVDIVKKVVNDLVKYRIVQRAFFGGSVVDYNYENAKKYSLSTDVKSYDGVLLESMEREGPAAQAGLKPGDIITQVDNKSVDTQSEFEEVISYHYPGDKMNVTFKRNGQSKNATITLVNQNGETSMIQRKIYSSSTLGAQLEGSDYGVKVFKIEDGGYMKKLGIPENYTIISINRVRVSDPKEVMDFFDKYKGNVALYGITASKEVLPFNFRLR